METLVDAFKTHKMWFVIGGVGFLGILAYAFLHRGSSSSGTGQQDLLVSSQTSGPSPVIGTTQTTNTGAPNSDNGVSAVAPASPVSPVDAVSPIPATPITPASPASPVSPVSPGGLVTPNLPVQPVAPFVDLPTGNPPSIAITNPVQPAAPAQLTQSYAISPPKVFGVGIAPQTTMPQSPAAVKAITAASTPNYVGTPLGPGTPVITGPSQAAQTRTTATSGGQSVKVVPQGAKVFGVGISPNSTR